MLRFAQHDRVSGCLPLLLYTYQQTALAQLSRFYFYCQDVFTASEVNSIREEISELPGGQANWLYFPASFSDQL